MQAISVTIALDENYAPHTAALIASIFTNSKTNNITIYLLCDNLTQNSKNKLAELVGNFLGNIEIIEGNIENFYTSAHLSKAAYLRLKIPELLPETVSKTVYLDADLLVKGDIAELFNVDLKGKPLGAALDLGIMTSRRSMAEKRRVFGFDIIQYFNSGVLVLDLDKWRENNYTEKLLDMVKKHNFRHHDQDALNMLFYNNWHEIPLEFNVIPPVFELPLKVIFSPYRKLAAGALRNAKIIHYAGGHKPWHYKKTVMLNDYYYDMLAKTSFEISPQDERIFRKYREIFRILWGRFWASIF